MFNFEKQQKQTVGKLGIYSIQDTKSETYNPPFFQKTLGECTRTFSKLVNDHQSLLSQFPEDFVLVQLGTFDENSGEIISHSPVVIATASQYIKPNYDNSKFSPEGN